MDTSRLNQGEVIAGISGIVLFIVMFFGWWGIPEVSFDFGGGEITGAGGGSVSAWEAADLMDIIWALTALAGIGLAVVAASSTEVDLPIALSAIVTGLGALSLVLIIIRLIDPPYDLDREFWAFVGLVAIGGITAGGWMAMQEEGASFSGPPTSRGEPPPPPPPPAAPTQ